MVVYGETEEESESVWCIRAESTNQLLHTVLISAGAQPDSLIPEDTFSFSFDPETVEDTPPPLLDGYDLTMDQGSYPMITGTTNNTSSSSSSSSSYPRQSVIESADGTVQRVEGGPSPWGRPIEVDLTKSGGDGNRQGDSIYTNGGNESSSMNMNNGTDQSTMPLESDPESSLGMGLSDGMTDEQLIAYLSSTYS